MKEDISIRRKHEDLEVTTRLIAETLTKNCGSQKKFSLKAPRNCLRGFTETDSCYLANCRHLHDILAWKFTTVHSRFTRSVFVEKYISLVFKLNWAI